MSVTFAPECPLHPGTPMALCDGNSPRDELKFPHYRCEFRVGSGVCGYTLPTRCGDPELQGPPEEIGTGLYRMVDGEVCGNDPEPPQF